MSRAAAIEVKVELPDSADGRWCIERYFMELAQRFENGFDHLKSNPGKSLARCQLFEKTPDYSHAEAARRQT